jgi:transposase
VEGSGAPRLLRPDRAQLVFEDSCLELQLAPDHRGRQIWRFVELTDTAPLEDLVGSREGRAGAPAIDPRLLLALWLYACLDGVGSARELDRLCREHVAYRWLCGRVGVNHHTLSDFRSAAGGFLDDLLTDMIAALVKAGVVDGSEINQDGTKVRASAGQSSFRREESLERLRQEARGHVERVAAQADDQQVGARARAARERAARERQERVEGALHAMEELKRVKERNKAKRGNHPKGKAAPRASTTDPDSRQMKMGDGGSRPAYNVQLATDSKSRAIVGVQVLTAGSDQGLTESMRLHVEERTAVKVRTHITDAGYISKATIEREEMAGVACVIPLPRNRLGQVCTSHPSDGPGVQRWRERMQTQDAKDKLRRRSGIAETPNAELKTYRAMDRLLVRGIAKATGVVLLGAIVYNLVHFAGALIGQAMHAA